MTLNRHLTWPQQKALLKHCFLCVAELVVIFSCQRFTNTIAALPSIITDHHSSICCKEHILFLNRRCVFWHMAYVSCVKHMLSFVVVNLLLLHCIITALWDCEQSPQVLYCIPYLTLPAGWMPALRQTPSAEATAWAQCTTPTDLKVGRTS